MGRTIRDPLNDQLHYLGLMVNSPCMLTALLYLALTTQEGSGPAFLDSFQTIHVPLGHPMSSEDLKISVLVTVGSKNWAVKSVRPCGDPVKDRHRPRTPGRVVLPGTIQSALGGADWNPDGEETQMVEAAPGVYELVVILPSGNYEFKVARNGSWDENYGVGFVPGGGNFHLTVPQKEPVKFVVDFNAKTVLNSIDQPSQVRTLNSIPVIKADPAQSRYQVAEVTLATALPASSVDSDIEVKVGNQRKRRVYCRDVLDSPLFNYAGPLGTAWSPRETTFRVWSPASRFATVLIYDSEEGPAVMRIPMTKTPNGVWVAAAKGDLNRKYYQYEFESYGEKRVTADISCRSASYGSRRSQVVDLGSTNPKPWIKKLSKPLSNPVDAIVYEASVRDLTVSPLSGVPLEQRGKYAGLGRFGTVSPGSRFSTGLDYIRRLGVTHIQILPIQDFLTSSKNEYSWGYATCLFNVPEETYGVNPNDRVGVISEVKEMISHIHQAGLRVVMDVVYNHTWPPQGKDSPFWQTAPYYYFRTDLSGNVLNESGVGNALDDDSPMARKYVLDSLLYWQNEFGIDGFRFDLLGMYRKSSVAAWTAELHRHDPGVLIYGEPWTGGGPTRFGKGAQRGLGCGVFNDDFRNVFRGELDGSAPGFTTGGGADRDSLVRALKGSTGPGGFALLPSESINYVSAHDNLTLFDRLRKSLPDNASVPRAIRLSCAAVLLSQGVPFLEGGAELGRTKGGNRNSYNAGDAVNEFDWQRATQFTDVSSYLTGLISVRKAEPGLRLRTPEEIKKRVHFKDVFNDFIAFSIDETGLGGPHSKVIVALNGSRLTQHIPLPPGTWQVVVDGIHASNHGQRLASGPIGIEPLTAEVIVQ